MKPLTSWREFYVQSLFQAKDYYINNNYSQLLSAVEVLDECLAEPKAREELRRRVEEAEKEIEEGKRRIEAELSIETDPLKRRELELELEEMDNELIRKRYLFHLQIAREFSLF